MTKQKTERMKRICDIGEDKLIKRFSHKYRYGKHTIISIGDDAAILKSSKDRLSVFTTDMLVEDVHFKRREATPYQIGWKAIGSSLSDIASMAAIPMSAVVSLGLPQGLSVRFVDSLIKGIETLARRFSVDIVGGDTISSPKGSGIIVSISVIGEVEKKEFVLRKGAKVGDRILVTGYLGGSRKRKQYRFIPRIREAQWLVKHGKIHSMMDITDGLSLDLYRLVISSGVGARIYKDSIPVSHDARGFNRALVEGEDFELLIVASSDTAQKLLKKWNISYKKVPLSIIGEIIKNKGRIELTERSSKTKKLVPKGYEHFANYKKS